MMKFICHTGSTVQYSTMLQMFNFTSVVYQSVLAYYFCLRNFGNRSDEWSLSSHDTDIL